VSGTTADLALVVHEVAMNSVRHGGDRGRFRLWSDGDAVDAQVDGAGTIADPLAGRRRPGASSESGRGLWLANHLSDLLQVRSSEHGTSVRVHMAVRSGTRAVAPGATRRCRADEAFA
jgi:anti-sigma regulatory factor (Ser/Thr protein kinase)